MKRRWRHRVALVLVGLVSLMLLAACGTDDEATAEPPPPAEAVPATTGATEEPTTTENEEPAAEPSMVVDLVEQNASGQAGSATVTPNADGVGVSVEINSADMAQYALVARGNCEALEEPFANIEGSGEQELTGGTKSGRFETAELETLADGAPAALADLQEGEFAILVVDVAYRGGVAEEIPPDVLVFQGPDPAGPYGETAYPIAAAATSRSMGEH